MPAVVELTTAAFMVSSLLPVIAMVLAQSRGYFYRIFLADMPAVVELTTAAFMVSSLLPVIAMVLAQFGRVY
jgi:hypothetical protein